MDWSRNRAGCNRHPVRQQSVENLSALHSSDLFGHQRERQLMERIGCFRKIAVNSEPWEVIKLIQKPKAELATPG
jgi:hypothetical protein